jgi:hypothetical protein
LEQYHDQNNTYPVIFGKSAWERWGALEKFFKDLGQESDFFDFSQNFSRDLCAENGSRERSYDYVSSPDGQQYVLKAIMSDPDRNIQALDSIMDLDQEVLGIWCGTPGQELEFCMGKIK